MKLAHGAKPGNLRELKNEPDQNVIETLEYFMEEAKAGRLTSVLVLGSGRNEDGASCEWSKCAGNAYVGEVIEAFELWKYRRMQAIDEKS